MDKKKWITAVAAIAMTATLAFAAENVTSKGEANGFEGKEHHGFAGGERMADKLNLTDAQRAQWKQANDAFRLQNEAFFKQARQTREDFHAAREANDTAKMDALKATVQSQHQQMKQLRDAQDQKLMSILNADQKAQFEAFKAARAAHRGHREGGQE